MEGKEEDGSSIRVGVHVFSGEVKSSQREGGGGQGQMNLSL